METRDAARAELTCMAARGDRMAELEKWARCKEAAMARVERTPDGENYKAAIDMILCNN